MSQHLFIEGYVKQDGLVGEIVNVFHYPTGAYLQSHVLGEDVWRGQRVYVSNEDGRLYGLLKSADSEAGEVEA